MMETSVRFLPAAEEEVSDAFRWYEDKAEGLGSDFMRALDDSLTAIQRNPQQYPLVHKQIRRALLRRFPYGLFYLIDDETIVIVACFHGSRDPKEWQERE